MRGKTPEELARLERPVSRDDSQELVPRDPERGGPTDIARRQRLRGSATGFFSGTPWQRARKVRSAAERGRGQHARLERAGLAVGERHVANVSPAGSPSDDGTRGSIDRASHRIPETRIRGRSPGAANDAVRLDSRASCGTGLARSACLLATCRIPCDGGASSRGEESQESTDPVKATPARVAVAARTDSRGEQGFEVGVPAVHRRARFRRADRSRSRRSGVSTDRSSLTGIRRPGPCVPASLRASLGKGSAQAVKVG